MGNIESFVENQATFQNIILETFIENINFTKTTIQVENSDESLKLLSLLGP